MTIRQYKNLKGLKKESLRDNMSTTELVLNMLAETAIKEFSQSEKPGGLSENFSVAKRGDSICTMVSSHPSHRHFKQHLIPDFNSLQSVLLFLIEVEAEHIARSQMEVIQIFADLFFALRVISLATPDL